MFLSIWFLCDYNNKEKHDAATLNELEIRDILFFQKNANHSYFNNNNIRKFEFKIFICNIDSYFQFVKTVTVLIFYTNYMSRIIFVET